MFVGLHRRVLSFYHNLGDFDLIRYINQSSKTLTIHNHIYTSCLEMNASTRCLHIQKSHFQDRSDTEPPNPTTVPSRCGRAAELRPSARRPLRLKPKERTWRGSRERGFQRFRRLVASAWFESVIRGKGVFCRSW